MPIKDLKDEAALTAENVPAKRLTELLGYVEQVVKMDERPAFKLTDFRLANGQSYSIQQNEFHALPGITHDDQGDDETPVWLRVARLKRRNAPAPKGDTAAWIVASNDPNKQPTIRESILRTVTASERDALVAKGEARQEDKPTLDESKPKHFDVRLRLEDRPEIAAQAQNYIGGPWLSWSNEEKPRRRTICESALDEYRSRSLAGCTPGSAYALQAFIAISVVCDSRANR